MPSKSESFFSPFKRTLRLLMHLVLLLLFSVMPAAADWYEDYGIASKRELTAPASVPGLIRALEDRDAGVRKLASGYLAKIGPAARDAIPALMRCMTDKDANVRKNSVAALIKIGYRGADFNAALAKMAAEDPHRGLRGNAAKYQAKYFKTGASGGLATSAVSGTPGDLDFPKAEAENRYGVAVIIGNRNYAASNRDVPDVDFAINDAQAMYQYVTQSLGFREGNVIFLKDATQADLISTFGTRDNPKGKLYDWIRPNQSDIFIFYSGHGAPGLSNGQGYLLPVDGNPMKVELNGYPLETFYANVGRIPARSTTIVIDACFSGSSASGAVVRSASSISLKLVDAKVDNSKATVLTAAGLSEVASWDTEAKHGLFTSHFLKGITGEADADGFGNGDGKVSLGEMKKYLQEEVTYNARRLYGRDQNPQISGNPGQILIGN
jgi:hypothetical protein